MNSINFKFSKDKEYKKNSILYYKFNKTIQLFEEGIINDNTYNIKNIIATDFKIVIDYKNVIISIKNIRLILCSIFNKSRYETTHNINFILFYKMLEYLIIRLIKYNQNEIIKLIDKKKCCFHRKNKGICIMCKTIIDCFIYNIIRKNGKLLEIPKIKNAFSLNFFIEYQENTNIIPKYCNEILQILIDVEPNILHNKIYNIYNHTYFFPLHIACKYNYDKLLSDCINRNVNTNCFEKWNNKKIIPL